MKIKLGKEVMFIWKLVLTIDKIKNVLKETQWKFSRILFSVLPHMSKLYAWKFYSLHKIFYSIIEFFFLIFVKWNFSVLKNTFHFNQDWTRRLYINFHFFPFYRKWLLKHLLLKYPIPQASDDASHRDGNNEQNQNYHQLADDVHPQDNSNGHHICQHHANTAVNQTLHNIFLQELKVSTSAASRYQCNYYAWNHRMWLMKHCLKYSFVVSNLHLNCFFNNT